MTGNLIANVREFGFVSLMVVMFAVPALVASSNGIRPLDPAYLLTVSGK